MYSPDRRRGELARRDAGGQLHAGQLTTSGTPWPLGQAGGVWLRASSPYGPKPRGAAGLRRNACPDLARAEWRRSRRHRVAAL